ncbi:unnamed protein product [Linum tenue]|uniref:Uncharacterized protein n=1 Tax=Linum tenue TaxID=586396 RepID=A0AAV0N5T8_9ROSI|nr:unnamed protein product [Linum tenue]
MTSKRPITLAAIFYPILLSVWRTERRKRNLFFDTTRRPRERSDGGGEGSTAVYAVMKIDGGRGKIGFLMHVDLGGFPIVI